MDVLVGCHEVGVRSPGLQTGVRVGGDAGSGRVYQSAVPIHPKTELIIGVVSPVEIDSRGGYDGGPEVRRRAGFPLWIGVHRLNYKGAWI